jgi:hypothetical protein
MSLSKMIRDKKKNKLKPDLDDAGQESVDPNEAWDMKQADEVNEATGDEDHEPASAKEMGEDDSSQSKKSLKRASSITKKYFDSL